MANNIKKHSEKKHTKKYQNFLKKKNKIGQEKPKEDIKI